MRVGEARALEIGHRIGLAPDDVVQDPESLVLQLRADTKDVVVAADHPQRTVILQDAARRLQPFGGEAVIGLESVELVPIVGHRVDAAALRTEKVAAKLEIIGRIRKDQIDRVLGQFVHGGDAVALNYHIQRQGVSSHWTPVKQQKSTLNHPESQGNPRVAPVDRPVRSEEHTSELQSLMRISYAVFCLKQKTNTKL